MGRVRGKVRMLQTLLIISTTFPPHNPSHEGEDFRGFLEDRLVCSAVKTFMPHLLDDTKKLFIHSYTLIPLKNPVDPKNIITRRKTTKMSPKSTMTGRMTAKIAFPVEIRWPSLTPMMVRMKV
jgi:hypothetical protein